MKYQIYHERLSDCLAESGVAFIKAGAEISVEAWVDEVERIGYINYGECARLSIPMLKLRGKTTRRHLQVSITRLDSGLYELTQYFL